MAITDERLLERLNRALQTPWPAARFNEASSLWHAMEWQKTLWGVAWMRTYVGHAPLSRCVVLAGHSDSEQRQLDAIRRGVECSHPVCQAWHRLYRRTTALRKVLSPESDRVFMETSRSRFLDLRTGLRTRFGALDDPESLQPPTPSESLPSGL